MTLDQSTSCAPDLSKLSESQTEVLSRLARRQSYKTIADKMGISQSRVNQHIRAMKNRLGVNDPAGLVELWLSAQGERPSIKDAYTKSQLPPWPLPCQRQGTAGGAVLPFRDAGSMSLPLPWQDPESVRVGPGYLDGPGGTARRIGFMLLVAIGFPVAVVATLSAMMALTEMLRSMP